MKREPDKTPTTKAPAAAAPRLGLPVSLGQLVATPGALAALSRHEILTAISRHTRGDWGDCGREDAAENDFALGKRLRLFSVYHAADGIVKPAYGEAYAKLIPGARFEQIANAGHHPEIEQPGVLVERVGHFLRS